MTDKSRSQPAASQSFDQAYRESPVESKQPEVDQQLVEATRILQEANEAYAKHDLKIAEEKFRQALQLKPDLRDAQHNLGVLLRDENRFDEAKQCFQSIIDAQPRAALAQNNLGIIAEFEKDPATAEKAYRQAIEDNFQLALAHFNLGRMLLQQGRFEEGWKECEWRWQTPEFTRIRCLQPLWNGGPLKGTLLLHTEQGAGDTFQFARFIPEIRRRVDRVMFICPENLHCMFQRGDWVDELLPPGDFQLDQFQAILPLLSAPYALGLKDEAAHGAKTPYLTPEKRTIDLGAPHVDGAKLRVGVAWAGSPTHRNDHYRSLHARQLGPLFEVPEIAFYSLQKGPQSEQLQEIAGQTPSLRDLDARQQDFADTAAIIEQLDLVISVDTSVLHLAAGLNKPVWCLLSDRFDWRWMDQREDSYWYPTLRLFRQQQLDDWNEVLQRVAAELKAVVAGDVALA